MRIIALFIIVFCLSACHKSFYLDVMHPAEVILENDMDTLLLVSRTNHANGIKSTKGKILEAVVTQSISTGFDVDGALNFMVERVAVNERLSLATNEVLKVNNSNLGYSSPNGMPSEIIDSLCQTYNASGVISLESIAAEEQGTTAENKLRLIHSTWKLYAPDDVLVDEIVITTYGSSKPMKDLPSSVKITNSAIHEAAFSYLRRISPEYYKEYRSYYSGYLANMKLAKKAMKSEDYKLAKGYWEALAAKPDLKKGLQAKLAYNLALAYEIEGELELALTMAKKALKKGIPTALRYVEQLELQILEKPIIELQLVRE